jgi:carboxymethylenebutenolidase
VVIHEAFGLNADIRRHADRLAGVSYLALAPDLLEGKSWLRCIRGMFRQIAAGSGPAFELLDACRGWLAARPDCTGKTGVIGFCMGGGFALMCAPRDGYSAAAVNYGVVPSDAENALSGSCPVVGSYGGRDMMGVSHPQRLEAALTALGVPHDVKVYPEAGHSFMSPKPAAMAPLTALARLQYDKGAAEDAWQRIFAFFGTYLSESGSSGLSRARGPGRPSGLGRSE